MERIFKAAKAHGFEVFISPHYFYPVDRGWKFNGPLETDEVTSSMFARKGVLNLDGLEGSGADWLERFKPYIQDGKTIVVSPHRVWGPETYNADRNVATGNPYRELVADLMKRGVQIELCGATAKAHKWGNADLLPLVKVNTDAMSRTTQLVQEGFVKITE